MKTLTSVACVLLMLGAGASAQTLDDLKKDGNGGSTDNILTYGMGYHQQRYSPLIPNPIDQNSWAHWRSPMDMMRQG